MTHALTSSFTSLSVFFSLNSIKYTLLTWKVNTYIIKINIATMIKDRNMAHINTIIPETLDALQFAYPPNRSTDDTITIALHTALSHLYKRNTYVRMLFIDYSSAFNTIVPSKVITKLRNLGLNTSLCNWILDYLTGCPRW